jgi:hypothetical protein
VSRLRQAGPAEQASRIGMQRIAEEPARRRIRTEVSIGLCPTCSA